MGNVCSSHYSEDQKKLEVADAACAKSSSLSSHLPVPNIETGRQLKRSVSLDGFSVRLNESFRRIYRSISCTSLNITGSRRSRSADQSCSRPWSRVSRRRWHDTTLNDNWQLSKACWPVTHAEALFLPHFPIDSNAELQYSVVSHVANGAFGKVFRVRNKTQTKADFALKIYSKSEIINGNAIRQLKDEVDIQTICGHHPFLVKCLRYWQTKKKVFLLSNYYPNGELFQKYKKFPCEIVRLYVAELALALDFLHQAGIIYRDLKPENILLDDNYHVRLIDFGLSKWLSIGSRTRTLCGTFQYMAPEILNCEPYGHAVDWWALGVLACQMYTGEILVSTLLVAANAQYNGYNRDPKTVAIVSEQRYLAGDGQFGAAYDQEDGTNFKEETDADGNRRGSYSYVDPSGQRRTISYVAGKNGFQASGDHLPVAPAAPPAPAHAAPQPQYQPQYQPQAQSQPQYNANFDHQGRSYDSQGYEDGQYDPRWNDPSFSQQHSRPAPAPIVTPAPAPVHNYHQQPAPVNTYRHQQPAQAPVAHNYNHVPAAPQPQPQHQDWTTPAPHRFQPPGKLQLNRTPDGFSYTFNKV